MSAVTMTVAMERALRAACVEMGDTMLTSLAEHYKIDAEELRRVSGLTDLVVTKTVKKAAAKKERKTAPKKVKKAVPSIPLPFIGVVNDDVCYGIRLNHGLHTQCANDRVDGMDYCKTCVKHAEKNASGKPSYGDIRDRVECGLLEYRDPKGKQTLPYINVVEKLGLDIDAVKVEAAKFGVEIPDEHLVKRETKRGRPKKDVTDVSDTDSEASKPKKRGRPRKEKQVESVVADDLLTALKNAHADAKSVIQDDDASSVKSDKSNKSNKSGGRPRLSEEEKQKRAEVKAAEKLAKAKARAEAKAAKEAAKEAEKEAKAKARAEAKAAKEAAKEAKKDTTNDDEEFGGCAAGVEAAKAEAAKAEAAKANAEQKKDETPKETADEEESVKVKKFELNGVTYLRTADNVLYDIDTQEPVGIYDPETGVIEDVDAVTDEEDSEEDDE